MWRQWAWLWGGRVFLGGRFCGVLFAGFFAMFLYFLGRIRVAVFAGYSGKVVLFL